MYRFAFLLLAASIHIAPAGPLGAQRLTAPEEQVVAYVEAHNEEAIALLRRVVNTNSGTMNFAGVRRVGDVFAAEFEALGFDARWEPGESFERSGHLIAERSGDGPRLLLIGHLDTVFEKDSPFQQYEFESEQRVRGPGIVDMKGGNVIVVYALKALESIGALDKMSVTVIFTGDEERMGQPADKARASLIAAAKAADYAIAFENGDNDPTTAVVSRRGSTRWYLNVEATPAHSSQIFREDIGAGAIYESARILDGFYESMAGEPFLTFNPGLIAGGTDVDLDVSQSRASAFGKNNVIAKHATVAGDLRTISPEQLAEAKKRMEAIVADNRPHATATISFVDVYPPLSPTDGNKRLLAMFDEVSRDLGYGPVAAVDPMKAGAADVAFTAGLVDMAIDGLGLCGDGDHTEGEYADLRTLPMQTKRAAVLLLRLSGN